MDKNTPLHIAVMGRLHGLAGLLLESKADPSLGCKDFGRESTCLHQATMLRDVPMIRLLIEHGADVEACGRDKWTPLGLAVRSGAVDAAKALLDAKASVNTQVGASGKSVLEIATINNKPTLVELMQAVALECR